MMLRLIMTMVLCFGVTIPFTACGKNTKENTGGDDANWTAQIPNIEGSLTKPNTAMPVVDTESLYGDYDETNADCFLELTGRGAVAYIQEGSVLESKDVTIARNNIYGTDTTFGTVIEIKKSGTYVLQGDLSQGFVSIAKKDIDVTLVLNGVNIYCANYAPIVCLKKSNIQIHLAPNSTNYLTDGGVEIDTAGKYTINYDGEEQPNATILTRKDLVINGTGTLIVNGNGNNGIGSRANLTIESGNITINAKNNAIKGNDTVSIAGGTFNISSQSDGIKTESVEEAAGDRLGTINISGGTFVIFTINDGIQSSAALNISDAIMQIQCGNSSFNKATDNAKGLKAAAELVIASGTFEIDSKDDAIHCDNDIILSGGNFIISSGNDGIHADNNLTISNAAIDIGKSYEGIEGLNVTINSGTIKILSSDDGINGAGGADSSGYGNGFGMPSGSLKALITVAGGNIYITHSGSKSADGLDANGSIVITGGTLNITKPNGYTDYEPLDCDVSLTMTGGSVYIDGVLYTKDTITNIGGMQHGGSMNGKNPPRR
jgi:hypothetical protein